MHETLIVDLVSGLVLKKKMVKSYCYLYIAFEIPLQLFARNVIG